jgi:hypothetical protein
MATDTSGSRWSVAVVGDLSDDDIEALRRRGIEFCAGTGYRPIAGSGGKLPTVGHRRFVVQAASAAEAAQKVTTVLGNFPAAFLADEPPTQV